MRTPGCTVVTGQVWKWWTFFHPHSLPRKVSGDPAYMGAGGEGWEMESLGGSCPEILTLEYSSAQIRL